MLSMLLDLKEDRHDRNEANQPNKSAGIGPIEDVANNVSNAGQKIDDCQKIKVCLWSIQGDSKRNGYIEKR